MSQKSYMRICMWDCMSMPVCYIWVLHEYCNTGWHNHTHIHAEYIDEYIYSQIHAHTYIAIHAHIHAHNSESTCTSMQACIVLHIIKFEKFLCRSLLLMLTSPKSTVVLLVGIIWMLIEGCGILIDSLNYFGSWLVVWSWPLWPCWTWWGQWIALCPLFYALASLEHR